MDAVPPAGSIPPAPYLKPWYRLARQGDRLVLEYAQRAVVLEGAAVARLLPALLPLLDGTRPLDAIVAELGEPAAPAVTAALELLGRHGLLTSGPPLDGAADADATAALLAATLPGGPSPQQVHTALAGAVAVVAGSGAVAAVLPDLLDRSGVGLVERAPLAADWGPVDLLVAVPAAAELPVLEEVNRHALAQAVPWLPVLPFDGRLAPLGPLYLPGESCCYECYRLRRAANSPYTEEYWALEQARAAYPSSPAVEAASAGVAAHLALRWLAGRDPTLPGTLFALEQERVLALTAHQVLRVPRCPACSPVPAATSPAPWFDAVPAAREAA